MKKILFTLIASTLFLWACENESNNEALQIDEQQTGFALKFNAQKDPTLISQIQSGITRLEEQEGTARNEDGAITGSVLNFQKSMHNWPVKT
jgi:uncharacterized lipoprotein NlpE involved in copper resistance